MKNTQEFGAIYKLKEILKLFFFHGQSALWFVSDCCKKLIIFVPVSRPGCKKNN